MSTVAFLSVAMHGHINPTLPIVAELVRRGHRVTYHTSPAFFEEIAATGASVHLTPGGDMPLPDPPIPLLLLKGLAAGSLGLLPPLLDELRRIRPDLIVHDSACVWGAVAARELAVPAVSSFTTFAFNRHVPSPSRPSWSLLRAAARRPRSAADYARSRSRLHRRFDTRGVPLLDLADIRQPLNLVYTSRAFQPGAETSDRSFRFVGPSIGARPHDPSFPVGRLREPVLYASLGTVFDTRPWLLRTLATALAPLGGTVVVSTGHTDPAELGPLPANVLALRSVPQLRLLSRTALFVTHGGMNSVNEALYAGVPMLVVPQGADQPLVARRVAELGAGLVVRPEDATVERVRGLARRVLEGRGFRTAVEGLRDAQRAAGGFARAADELERHLRRTGAPGIAALPGRGGGH